MCQENGMSSSPTRRPLTSRQSNKTTNELAICGTSVLVAILLISFASLYYYLPFSSNSCSTHKYNSTPYGYPRHNSDGDVIYKIVAITDLDQDSKHPTKKDTWRSWIKPGELLISHDKKIASVAWDDEHSVELLSQIGAGGRSMELSDLVVFDGNLLTVDDRTGLVYKIVNFKDMVPWVLLNDGPGNVTKGFKAEWMTVKNEKLYVGGLGKEWTTTEGVFVNYNPMWIKTVDVDGAVEHVDWINNYKKIRAVLGIDFPGYMIHESGQWSQLHKKWYFMPRRASNETYTEANDEFRGTDLLLVANENFDKIEVHHVGNKGDGARGFSAFQFVPDTHDDLIVALKSEEKDGKPVGSYVTVFRVSDGHVLLEEQKLKGDHKFEGLAFV